MNKIIFIAALLLATVNATASDLFPQEKTAIMAAVKHDLKDPDTAKFKWPKLADKINPKHFVDSYCGLVNAKNSYGAYTGFEPFEAQVARTDDGKFEVISVTVSNENLTASDLAKMCSSAGYADLVSTK
jgi:hypothetical protein